MSLIAKRALKIGLAVVLAGMVAGAVLLYPYETSGVPEWRIQVLDSTGKPMVGVPVNEGWLDPIDEGNASGDQEETDATGTVIFRSVFCTADLSLNFAEPKRARAF